ncbi:MAG: hypothetical protein WCX64_00655 [Candidatus Micrarchaeia archaeon]
MISLHTPGQDNSGFGDPAGYGKRPVAPGIQESAYHGTYAKQKADVAAKAEPRKGGINEPTSVMTTAGCEVNPKDFPVMRTHTRYGFVMEYIDGWRKEKISWCIFVFWMAAAIFTFTVFPAGSLLMFALAARFRAIGAGLRWGCWTFGVKRTIMTVD